MKTTLFALLLALGGTPAFGQFQQVRDLTYDEALGLQLDLYLPDNFAPPYPVVVWVHGGGWMSGNRRAVGRANLLCPEGIAVAGIDYRFSDVAQWPAQIHDCKGAIRWLRANAGTYGLDPDRIGAWGSSSGGHLVACLGTMGGVGEIRIGNRDVDLEGTTGGNLEFSSRLQAVADWFGPTDFVHMRELPSSNHDGEGSAESLLVGGPIQENPDLCVAANSIPFVTPDDPPFLIMHGTSDPVVPYAQSEWLARALRLEGGVDVTFFPVQGAGHGGTAFEENDNLVVEHFVRWLKDRPEVTLSVEAADPTAGENNNPGLFTIRRTGSPSTDLPVRLWISGTATNGVDCQAISQFRTIPAGSLSVDVPVQPLQDGLVEGMESISLTLCPRDDYRIDASQDRAIVTLVDDESRLGLPVVRLLMDDATAAEPNDAGSFLVTRSGSRTQPLEVRYEVDGTAVNRRDFFLPGTVTIPAGAGTATIVVDPIDDEELESGEVLTLRLRAGRDYALGSAIEAGVLFEQDDVIPSRPIVSVTLTDTTAVEGTGDQATFTITRTRSTGSPLRVPFTMSGRAQRGIDYSLNVGNGVTIPAGENATQVRLTALQDTLLEGDESVVLTLASDPSWQLGRQRSVELTLQDDDEFSIASDVRLALSPLRSGGPVLVSISGPPGDRYQLRFSLEPGFILVPPYGILQLDPDTLIPGSLLGTLGPSGTAALAFLVPDGAAFQGLDLNFQAILTTPGDSSIGFSNRVERRIEKRVWAD